MAWFADLAGKAENLLNNLDEQTGVALRNHNVVKSKKHDYSYQQDIPSTGQKKRMARNNKKVSTATETRSVMTPSRKSSPISHQSRSPNKDHSDQVIRIPRNKKSPTRKPNNQFSLNQCPKTLVGDIKDSDTDDQFGLKQRRFSLPTDLELLCNNNITYKMQNLEVENAMLKNELNVMNREVSELLDRLRRTEDGNNVVNGFSEELNKTQIKNDSLELQYQRLGIEKDTQGTQMEQLRKKIYDLTNVEVVKYKDQNQALETEIAQLKDKNQELEMKIKQLNAKSTENNSAQIKLENDLRHAQSVIGDLQGDLEKSTEECRRLEKEWETYKLRVKSMLHAKDNEIKALQEGLNLNEDTKALAEQLESLREEREILTASLEQVRGECGSVKAHSEQQEARRLAAERLVTALRDALRDERGAKNRAEAQCSAVTKELKTVQLETGQTIASLRTALRDKDEELSALRSASVDTSALNVADYDVMQEQADNDKIKYLTETLVQRQTRLDALLRDNNSLRIQLDKLESKYKAEVASKRANHSVVHVDERVVRRAPPTLTSLSARVGVAMRRHPLFRTFVVIYMVCLHLWVLTVLLTSTPDGHAVPRVKS